MTITSLCNRILNRTPTSYVHSHSTYDMHSSFQLVTIYKTANSSSENFDIWAAQNVLIKIGFNYRNLIKWLALLRDLFSFSFELKKKRKRKLSATVIYHWSYAYFTINRQWSYAYSDFKYVRHISIECWEEKIN